MRKGNNEKPVLLLQGNFNETREIALLEINDLPKEIEGEVALDVFGFELKENEAATEARYLIEEGVKGEKLNVYVSSSEIPWHEAESMIEGSYLVVSLKNGENRIVITENRETPSLWGGVVLVVLGIFMLAIILERELRK